jgi:serine/threonine protein kinase
VKAMGDCQIYDHSDLKKDLNNPIIDTKYISIFKLDYKGKIMCVKASKLATDDPVIKHEILMLRYKLKHKNIISFIGHDKYRKSFIMELADCDLYDLLDRKKTIDMKSLLNCVGDGLKYLHEDMLIIHGDIKMENVVYFKKENIFKLIDFGTSGTEARYECLKAEFPDVYFNMGTIDFYSPEESCERQNITKSYPSDMWKLGLVCYEVLTNKFVPKSFDFETCSKDGIKLDYLPILYGLLKISYLERWTISNFMNYVNEMFK